MAGLYVNDEGVWKLPKSIWINDGTSTTGATGWRVCKNVYVNDNGFWREMIRSVDLTSSQSNFNLWNYVGSPTQPLSLIFNINANVTISSSDPVNNINPSKRATAFVVGNFPAGSTVIINNNGYISGGGGFGGRGAEVGRYNASGGGAGGYALERGGPNNYDITLVNTGTIAGGGGGGGGGYWFEVGALNYTQQTLFYPGNTGSQGAGISGYSRTQGGPAPVPQMGGGGLGGALGEPGQVSPTSQATGGAGSKAIGNNIEIAVSGTIIGGIG